MYCRCICKSYPCIDHITIGYTGFSEEAPPSYNDLFQTPPAAPSVPPAANLPQHQQPPRQSQQQPVMRVVSDNRVRPSQDAASHRVAQPQPVLNQDSGEATNNSCWCTRYCSQNPGLTGTCTLYVLYVHVYGTSST